MKRKTKILLTILGLGGAGALLSSCTASFCSTVDRSRVLYAFDVSDKIYTVSENETTVEKILDGVKVFGSSTYWNSIEEANQYGFVAEPLTIKLNNIDFTFDNIFVSHRQSDNEILKNVNQQIGKKYIETEGFDEFWYQLDLKAVALSFVGWKTETKDDAITRGYYLSEGSNTSDEFLSDIKVSELYNILLGVNDPENDIYLPSYGYLKYVDKETTDIEHLWINFDASIAAIKTVLTSDYVPTSDYFTMYKQLLQQKVMAVNTCIAPRAGYYGNFEHIDGNKGIYIEGKDWGYAFKKGFLEGLLIYPISWLIDATTRAFMGLGSGVAQLLAILVITFLIRALMLTFTIKQTIGNAKMSEIQPEISKIQAKYPNANTNASERNALASETQALYKKHKINPFSSLLTLFIQFPVFICVWGAMSGSSLLATGSFLGLNLSDSVSTVFTNFSNWPNNPGWWTATIMFLLMAGLQIVSMILPQIIQKRKAKKAVAQTGKNPNVKNQSNKMKWFTIIMVVMIIVMGFSLASGMVIYWIAGSIFSIAQTLLIEYINKRKAQNKGKGKTPSKKRKEAPSMVVEGDVKEAIPAPTGKKKYKDNK